MARSRLACRQRRPICASRCGAPSGDNDGGLSRARTSEKEASHDEIHPQYLLALAAVAALSACSSVKLDDQAPVESRNGAAVVPGNQNAARDAAASSQTRVAPVDASSADMAGMGNIPRIVYFDFDSYVVKDEYRPVVEANAKVLTSNPSRKMAVQGHTDDRGSSEYNLALGQRRAEAVVKSLTLLGVKPNQVEATSFGKERPAVQGENEEAWAKNRRAELMAAQ
jgi:peptidoglycan-associated lipoprotein